MEQANLARVWPRNKFLHQLNRVMLFFSETLYMHVRYIEKLNRFQL